jgi:hypothetical protein
MEEYLLNLPKGNSDCEQGANVVDGQPVSLLECVGIAALLDHRSHDARATRAEFDHLRQSQLCAQGEPHRTCLRVPP